MVDIHGHVTHPELFKLLPMPPALADIDGMLEQKAGAGIDITIVGSPVGWGTMLPVPGRDNFDQPLDQIKRFHDWLGGVVADHPGRLAAYVYTNPFGDEAMLREAARTVREPGFVGLIVNTSIRGEYLDSPRAEDFFAMADELAVPVLLHPPAEPVGTDSVHDFRLVEQLGRFVDVTLGLATLLFSGRLQRYPNLKLIGATGGGSISLVANRLDKAARMPRRNGGPGGRPPTDGPPTPDPDAIPQPAPSDLLRRIWVDTANSSVPHQLANLEMMGAGKMMFGTDSPPLTDPLNASIGMIEGLPVSESSRRGILGDNARELFGL